MTEHAAQAAARQRLLKQRDSIAEAGKPKPDGGHFAESVVAVSMRQPDIDRLLQWPYANVCSDGELHGAHPRGFGAFPRFFRLYGAMNWARGDRNSRGSGPTERR